MRHPLDCLHMNHINAMVEDLHEAERYFGDVYGGQVNRDLPGEHWQASLVTIGGVMFELFAPREYLLHARLGPHYVGIEYQVPNVEEARTAVKERGMRVIRELESAFHTHPAEAFGVAWEFFDRSFHDPTNPPVLFAEPIRPSNYWRDEHPIGYTGLKRYSIVVSDLDAATEFVQEFLGGKVLYEEERPTVASRAVGLTLGDTVAELNMPTGAGPVDRYLARYGNGIRSTVFGVRDLDQTRRYFVERGIPFHPGDAADSLSVPQEANLGLLFEFSE